MNSEVSSVSEKKIIKRRILKTKQDSNKKVEESKKKVKKTVTKKEDLPRNDLVDDILDDLIQDDVNANDKQESNPDKVIEQSPVKKRKKTKQIENQDSEQTLENNTIDNKITEDNKINNSEEKEDNQEIEEDRVEQNLETIYVSDLKKLSFEELLKKSEEIDVENLGDMQISEIIYNILRKLSHKGHTIIGEGTIEILADGYGFLRSADISYSSSVDDIYISINQIKKFNLRTGDHVVGQIRSPRKNEKYFALVKLDKVNNIDAVKLKRRMHYNNSTPIFPQEKLNFELKNFSEGDDLSTRVIDVISPLGKGQRALIVAPPRTGKTILMKNIANVISQNHPEVSLMVLLIDERPEEVTDMARYVKGEVVSSTFDEPASRHIQVAEMVIEKAKRLAEQKKDVVILLDSITRLARAYNSAIPSSGKVLSGGVDSNALQRPKRFFGAARNLEEGGSITIIATALIDTGSRMDDVIFEEFKGTGNSEIILDPKLSYKRIYPAIDVIKSGTRNEGILVSKHTLKKMWMLRKLLEPMGSVDSVTFLLEKLKEHQTNEDFFEAMNS